MSLSVRLQHRLPGLELDVAFDAPAGVTVLFGPSGAGKTSVINAVAGLLKPDHAKIELDGSVLTDTANLRYLPPHDRRIGYIFQEARLFPHLSVRQNLLYGAWARRVQRQSSRFDDLVDLMGLGALLKRYPMHLSGGETQRVAIGRALLADPDLILADEPLASLDDARKEEILPYFERLRDDVKIPFLYVSHDAREVARLATIVVVLKDGRVQRQGTATDVLGDPAVVPVGDQAAGAVLEARVVSHHEDGLTELAAGETPIFLRRVSAPVGAVLRVRIAARDVILTTSQPTDVSTLNILKAKIAGITETQDHAAIVALDTKAGRILATVTQRSVARLSLEPGQDCHALIKTVAIASGNIGGAITPHAAGS